MFRDSWPKSHPLEPRTPVYHNYVSTPPPPPRGILSFKLFSFIILKNVLKVSDGPGLIMAVYQESDRLL